MGRIITLLTDFGVESTYPAQMKGVILGRCPEACLVDLSHGVPRHDLRTAAFMLAAAAPAFPRGTIHVAVVDPQVGTSRRILAAEVGGSLFLAPDNGLLTIVLKGSLHAAADDPARIVSVENGALFRPEVSSTFHGRDIFAPVAAELARGRALEDLGPVIHEFRQFDVPEPARERRFLRGEVVYVDSFGNLVTNLTPRHFEGAAAQAVQVHLQGAVITGLSRAYSDVPAGMLLAYIGSAGFLEVAVNRQSAATRLGAELGTPVRVAVAGR